MQHEHRTDDAPSRAETLPWRDRPLGGAWACQCVFPIREVRAERKGAALTYCARCGLPVPIAFPS